MKKIQAIFLLFCLLLSFPKLLAQQLKVYDQNGYSEKIVGEKSVILINNTSIRTEGLLNDVIYTGVNAGYDFVMKKWKENKLKYTSDFSAMRMFIHPYAFDSDIHLARKVIYLEKNFTEDTVFDLYISPVRHQDLFGLKLDSMQVNKSVAKVHKSKPFNDYTVTIHVGYLDDKNTLISKELPEIKIPLCKIGEKIMLDIETIPIPAKTLQSIHISVKEVNAHQQKAAENLEILENNEQRLNDLFKRLLEKLELNGN